MKHLSRVSMRLGATERSAMPRESKDGKQRKGKRKAPELPMRPHLPSAIAQVVVTYPLVILFVVLGRDIIRNTKVEKRETIVWSLR